MKFFEMRENIKKLILPFYRLYRSFLLYIYNYWLTRLPVYWVRKLYLNYVLKISVGRKSFVHMGCFFYPGKIIIGDNSVIGRDCHFLGTITIKNNVSITAKTYIFTVTHYKDDAAFGVFDTPVIIEDYAWVGAKAMILPGVKIGRGAILGAASTATKSVPDYAVFVGAPARQVGVRSREISYKLDYFPYFE
ncbi:acyltransferase [Metapseudomonas otitidis]|uniref:acyltransferase n=1 Tax=Metapseudomonas otitidis TaxID=319939 RepID=UPI003217E568